MSQRKVWDTIAYLEKRGLIEKIEPKLGGPSRGILFRIPQPVAWMAPDATLARPATVAPRANNKEKLDDDDLKENHHQRAEKLASKSDPVENHSRAAAPPERGIVAEEHLALVRTAYERATGNRWLNSDLEAYDQNGLRAVSAEKIVSAMEAVASRTPVKINSFRYLVRALTRADNPRSRAWQKKQLEMVVQRIRENAVGRADYSTSDFVEDVKRACAREAVPFDNEIFNELAEQGGFCGFSDCRENRSLGVWHEFVRIANALPCKCRAGGGSSAGTVCRVSVPRA